MKKPDKYELDQYIYDYGYDKALEFFNLTDNQADYILFGKEKKRREPQPFKEEEKEYQFPIDESKAKELLRVIKENYDNLQSQFLKRKRTDKININSETPEDQFHNAIIRIVEDTDRFNHLNDEDTLNYIRTRLFYQTKKDRMNYYRTKKKRIEIAQQEEFNEKIEQLINKYRQ